MEKPAGVPTEITDVPATAGSNWANPKLAAPVNVTGLVIVPTPGPPDSSVALIGTLTVAPPRTCWVTTELSVPGSSRTALICTLRLAAPVVVVKSPETMMKPEGCTVTVPVSSA